MLEGVTVLDTTGGEFGLPISMLGTAASLDDWEVVTATGRVEAVGMSPDLPGITASVLVTGAVLSEGVVVSVVATVFEGIISRIFCPIPLTRWAIPGVVTVTTGSAVGTV